MSNVEIGYAGVAILLALIALRIPIGAALIGVSFCGIWAMVGPRAAWGAMGIVPWTFTATWQLSSVPMFLLMGFVCYHAGLTKGLFEAARLWLSRLPGGIAVASIFGASGFAAVTGSSVACAAAMGRIAVPEMTRNGYNPEFATGTVAAAGTIGALIPPSILLILYGIIAQVPVGALFMGGVGAGLLTALGYVLTVVIRARLTPSLAPPVHAHPAAAERWGALVETWPVLVLMAGVLGGLFFGVFTPTEAGGAGAGMAVLIALIKRSLCWRGFHDSLMETLQTTASLFVIAIGANMLTRFMAISGAGRDLAALIDALGADPTLLLVGIALVYLVLGMFLEPIGAMLLTLPVLLPVLTGAGYDLLWFGIVLAKFLEIGMITPPIGLNVFVIKSVVGDLVSVAGIFRGILWFLLADLIVVTLLVVFPDIILWLPALMQR
ncbi:TRAP transporter large permease [Albimonas sp. CAU 1670]|uniref:TRAP transporter large permease n=1 Tax=Albimonas sp. CAU 1670 TaxID=3032599 RepID=UPI0023DB6E55|nr:TRAP transporter large permease [Albimonas sp. CAU 1670]MDF2235702.1 TRAP transporter large permease [Albimonas sp. CAU 1670]